MSELRLVTSSFASWIAQDAQEVALLHSLVPEYADLTGLLNKSPKRSRKDGTDEVTSLRLLTRLYELRSLSTQGCDVPLPCLVYQSSSRQRRQALLYRKQHCSLPLRTCGSRQHFASDGPKASGSWHSSLRVHLNLRIFERS